MDLQARSFRVDAKWLEHLDDQLKRLSKKLGRRVYLYELMGACFMNFAPADDVGDREVFEQFIRAEKIKETVGDVSKMSDADKRALRKLLG